MNLKPHTHMSSANDGQTLNKKPFFVPRVWAKLSNICLFGAYP